MHTAHKVIVLKADDTFTIATEVAEPSVADPSANVGVIMRNYKVVSHIGYPEKPLLELIPFSEAERGSHEVLKRLKEVQ